MAFFRITAARAAFCLALFFAVAAPALRADRGKSTTPVEVFDAMRKSFNADKARGVNATYQWYISGPDGGDWFVVVADGKYRMDKGTIPNPDVTFTVSDKDWVALSNEELNGTFAYLTGRLKIKGPHSLAAKLDEIFP